MAYPEAVLFDNDGLVLDTEAVWSRAEQKLFRIRGVEFTINHKRSLVGSSAEIAGRKLAGFLAEPGRDAELMDELNALVLAELEGGVDAMVGARELIELLRLAGVPVGLVSNSPRQFIERSHEVAGTGLPFDAVVSGHEVPEAKPAPDAYLEACRMLGVEPGKRVIGLEDSPSGVTAAVAAGLFVIGVPSVPGIELDHADLVARSLEDEPVLHALGIESR
ncbi:MAG: HAD family phosphatase [Solirubrobacterales bacterium]|nr:HAD family phosphatase [Solirubrobacterales bacterium]HMT05318.1 HAD family phosphatase [Solirubrobacterales bacterium]